MQLNALTVPAGTLAFVLMFLLESSIALANSQSSLPAAEAHSLIGQASELRHEDPEAALNLLDTALNQHGEHYELHERVDLISLAAVISRQQGWFDRGSEYADQMIHLARQSNDTTLLGRGMHMRGTILAEKGEITSAIEDFHAARELFEENPDINRLALTINAIGLSHSLLENPQRAKVYYQQALPLAREVDNQSLELTILSNLAMIAAKLEGPIAGIELHQQALVLAREREDTRRTANQLANLCSQYVIAGMLDQAEPACVEALPLAETLGHVRLLAGTQMTFGDLLLEQGDLDEALQYYNRSLATIDGSLPFVEMELQEKMIGLHEQRGSFDDALSHMRQLTLLQEEMLNQQHQQAIEELEMRYQVEQTTRELNLLRLENELQAAEIRQQDFMLLATATALILVLIIALVTWRSYRMKSMLQQDLTLRNKKLNEAVERVNHLANRDSLTGLLNRRAFQEIAELENSKRKHNQTPLTIAVADVDKFKEINDQYGHPVGDEVLKATAQRIKQSLRDVDTVCRWGGEEFILMMPDTSVENTQRLIQRIRRNLAQDPIQTASGIFSITLTFGIAEVRSSIKEAIQAADDAMYAGKRAGSDRIVVSNLMTLVSETKN